MAVFQNELPKKKLSKNTKQKKKTWPPFLNLFGCLGCLLVVFLGIQMHHSNSSSEQVSENEFPGERHSQNTKQETWLPLFGMFGCLGFLLVICLGIQMHQRNSSSEQGQLNQYMAWLLSSKLRLLTCFVLVAGFGIQVWKLQNSSVSEQVCFTQQRHSEINKYNGSFQK
ncbi:hypothetical protein KOW79_002182 [Hemibagrus wyckioides]|uniref:Transmembrane protein n=1 Tax=Hemibagrus wyckioides TaxID=337641 RepID=A0A9D3P308_9TELE|nr:hypothetical protein KOW79_002182 [Hemibagrus wyckioides]